MYIVHDNVYFYFILVCIVKSIACARKILVVFERILDVFEKILVVFEKYSSCSEKYSPSVGVFFKISLAYPNGYKS